MRRLLTTIPFRTQLAAATVGIIGLSSLAAGLSPNRGVLRYGVIALPMEEARAINDRGEVVGTDANGALHWSPGAVRRIRRLPGLPPGLTFPEDINDRGEIVGQIGTNESGAITVFASHAFHWTRGIIREIRGRFDEDMAPALENNWTGVANGAYAINNHGDVLGLEEGFVLWRRAVLFQRQPLKLPFYARRSLRNRACDLNDAGQVAGTRTLSIPDHDDLEKDITHAVFWDRGKTRDIGTLGGKSSRAYRINNRATVVGWSHRADGQAHAFRWKDGVLRGLQELPGTESSVAAAVNDFDEIVGWCCSPSRCRAVLWRNGTVTDLNRLLAAKSGITFDFAFGINNRGQIIVNGERKTAACAFLLTPVKSKR